MCVDTAEIVRNIEITRVVHARHGENRDNLVLGAANETGFLQPAFVAQGDAFALDDTTP